MCVLTCERASEQAKERTNEYKSKRQTLQHFNTHVDINTLADPGGGAPGAPSPPKGRGPMIFLCPKRQFFSSLAINVKLYFNRNMAKACYKNDFYFNLQPLL